MLPKLSFYGNVSTENDNFCAIYKFISFVWFVYNAEFGVK